MLFVQSGILAPQNGRCIRYTSFSIPSWHPKMVGVSNTLVLGFIPSWPLQNGRCIKYTWVLSDLGPPKWQVYQINLAFYPILAPQNGRCIRYTWFSIPSCHPNGRCIRYTSFSIPSWHPKMVGVSNTLVLGFIPSWHPKMVGVSNKPGFLFHLGPPKWQVYQIHFVFYPILAPQNGRCIRYTWFSIPSCHPNGRCIRYTSFSIPSWHPKMVGVSNTLVLGFIPSWHPKMVGVSNKPGFLFHLGPPKWQVYQIHFVFYPILGPQNGNCIKDSWCKGVLKDVLCTRFLV